MRKSEQTGTLEHNIACFLIVQYALQALPTLRKKTVHSILDNYSKLEQPPKRAASDKSQLCEKSKSWSKTMIDRLFFFIALLDFPYRDTDDYFTTWLTCRLQTLFGVAATVMQTAYCFPATGAGVSFIRSFIISTKQAYYIKQDGLPTRRTAKKQPSPPEWADLTKPTDWRP